MMKRVLWLIVLLLFGDALTWWYVFKVRADYYFPDRYEDAYQIGALCLGLGVVLMIVFSLILAELLKGKTPDERDY